MTRVWHIATQRVLGLHVATHAALGVCEFVDSLGRTRTVRLEEVRLETFL